MATKVYLEDVYVRDGAWVLVGVDMMGNARVFTSYTNNPDEPLRFTVGNEGQLVFEPKWVEVRLPKGFNADMDEVG